MGSSQHDLLRLMESPRTANGIELIGVLAQRIPQELIESEATARIGSVPSPASTPRHARRCATGTGRIC